MSSRLEALELNLEPASGPLLPQVRRALAERLGGEAEALRWAITGVHPPTTATGRPGLTIEVVAWRPPLP